MKLRKCYDARLPSISPTGGGRSSGNFVVYTLAHLATGRREFSTTITRLTTENVIV